MYATCVLESAPVEAMKVNGPQQCQAVPISPGQSMTDVVAMPGIHFIIIWVAVVLAVILITGILYFVGSERGFNRAMRHYTKPRETACEDSECFCARHHHAHTFDGEMWIAPDCKDPDCKCNEHSDEWFAVNEYGGTWLQEIELIGLGYDQDLKKYHSLRTQAQLAGYIPQENPSPATPV